MPETFGVDLRRLGERLAYPAGWYLTRDASGQYVAGTDPVMRAQITLNEARFNPQRLRELAFLARGECCPKCGFGGAEATEA